MTHVINAVDVNDALVQGLAWLREAGSQEPSRNGQVTKAPGIVVTTTARPEQRVLHFAWRDANPFFHLYEAIWMMAGRRDVAPLERYVGRMREFSDNGVFFNAAYGHRWRQARSQHARLDPERGHTLEAHHRDQLAAIIEILRRDPHTRQCVLQIWNHEQDLGTSTKDHACNVAATFQVNRTSDKLDMVVFCRSNDAIWGAHGANAVHMSFLLEYVAIAIGKRVGKMTQVSVNYHAYDAVFDPIRVAWSQKEPVVPNYWVGHGWHSVHENPGIPNPHYPIMSTTPEVWDHDAHQFVTPDGTAPSSFTTFDDPFFTEVALPVVRAHDMWKEHRDADLAISNLSHCRAPDWRSACEQWIWRRVEDMRRKEARS